MSNERELTPKERERLPSTLLISWCAHCDRPDYAFKDLEEAKTFDLSCPYCEHPQSLIKVTVG